MVTNTSFQQWLDGYGAGWVKQDPKQTLAMFSDDASYMYTPFHKIMRGKDEIRRYVEKGAVGLQQDIEFSCEILAVTERYGIARGIHLLEGTGGNS